MSSASLSETLIHGTAVAVDGRGLLIIGKPGTGKSSLALDLISRGATLIADDRVVITRRDNCLLASAPSRLAGLIEARGLGLLEMPHTTAVLTDVVDLDTTETQRLPQTHNTVIADVTLPCLHKVESPAFAAMVSAYLKGGRRDV